MLSLSKKTDYALLALSYLARVESGRAVRTREIAEQYDLPIELLAKILQKLAKEGLLVSAAGPTGGYSLARNPVEITIGSVVKAIDGQPAFVHCQKTSHNSCEQHDKCTVRTPLVRISARLYQVLNDITLSEIAAPDVPQIAEITFRERKATGAPVETRS